LGLPGSQYDIDKLIYLGSTESGDPYVFVSRKEAVSTVWKNCAPATGLRSAPRQSVTLCLSAVACSAYLLGLKDPRMVVGYGGPEIDIALAKGEVDLRANGADTIFQRSREVSTKHRSTFTPTSQFPRENLFRTAQGAGAGEFCQER
jgi:hypothetical protein